MNATRAGMLLTTEPLAVVFRMFMRSPVALALALLFLGCGGYPLEAADPTWAPNPTATATPTQAPSPISPNNILVSIGNLVDGRGANENSVREFTSSGALVQTIRFNYNGTAYPITESLRDIVVDRDGSVASYNGSFNPFLTRYSSISGAFTHTTVAGWNTINNIRYGGIAAYRNFVFATDMHTFSGGEADGIVRFDTSSNTAIRFAAGADFIDLNIGLDGNLYALTSEQAPIRVYDPISMALLRQIPLPTTIYSNGGIRNVAADQTGRLFVCDTGDTVHRLSASGTLEASQPTGFFSLTDIDIDETGRLIIGEGGGRVILGESTLTNPFTSFVAITSFFAREWTIFVSFARPFFGLSPGPAPSPTPSPTPTPNAACPSTITQSASQAIKPGNSISCNLGPPEYLNYETNYWRAFNMTVLTASQPYEITSVSFGIESAFTRAGWGQAMGVILYTNAGGPFPGGTLTEIASRSINVLDQAQTVLTMPLSVTIPTGTSELVMRLFSPSGAPIGASFLVGSNAAGQTGPSYVSSAYCGNPTPTDTAALGFPNMHIVFGVNGSCRNRAAKALNISTRVRAETGDKAMIGGFIVTGNTPKSVLLRGIGPSLTKSDITDVLVDPVLALHGADQAVIFQNDNWKESPQRSQIEGTQFQPSDEHESVMLVSVAPGNYTASLSGAGEKTGVGLVEVYDTNQAANSQLGNISTRGFVQMGNNVMIGGFILGEETGDTRLAIRGLGPSLNQAGLSDVLPNPTLELKNSNGTTLVANDNWEDEPVSAAELRANGLALPDRLEAGIFTTLPPGAFTAILAGNGTDTGIGLVEVYNLR